MTAFLAAFLDDEETRVISRVPDSAAFDDPEEAMEQLADAPYSGPSAGFQFDQLSVRDFAAIQLSRIQGLHASAANSWKAADWRDLRDRVRDTLSKTEP